MVKPIAANEDAGLWSLFAAERERKWQKELRGRKKHKEGETDSSHLIAHSCDFRIQLRPLKSEQRVGKSEF